MTQIPQMGGPEQRDPAAVGTLLRRLASASAQTRHDLRYQRIQTPYFNAIVAPDHVRNARFSAWNLVGLVGGGIFFMLAVVGTFLPEK